MCPGAVRLAILAAGLGAAAAFGDPRVDKAAERAGLLLRCFPSRTAFFNCCGRFKVAHGGLLLPLVGCFPGLDAGQKRPGGRYPFGVYGSAVARCCREPIRLHRQMLQRAHSQGLYLNYTLLYLQPEEYVADSGELHLPGFLLHHLGAASMTEDAGSLLAAAWENRDEQIERTRDQFAVGSVREDFGIDGDEFLPVFEALRASGAEMSYAVLDVGANNGLDQSPLRSFHEKYGAHVRGAALEGARPKCATYRARFPHMEVHCGWLSAEGFYKTPFKSRQLEAACASGTPYCVDLWKVDIDSIDCTVVEVLMRSYSPPLRPKALIMEANTHFPPPYKFSLVSSPANMSSDANVARIQRGLFGCSLSHQVSFLLSFGYWLVSFTHKDALFLQQDIARGVGFTAPMDEFSAFMGSPVMISQDMLSPRRWRGWFGSPPHVGLAKIQAHLERLRGDVQGELAYSLSI